MWKIGETNQTNFQGLDIEKIGVAMRVRDLEKISFEQFKKDVKDDKKFYDEYSLPFRDSNKTAGYDI